MDPCAPSITFFDKDSGKGRVTYLGSLCPEYMFYPTKRLWFTNQGQEFIQMMMKKYEEEPYPTREAMEAIAKEVGAPDWTKIDSFYKNMHVKHQEEYQ